MRGNVSVSLATCEGATEWPVCRDATNISLLTPALSRWWTFKLIPVTSPHFLHSGSRGLVAGEKNPNLSAKDLHYLDFLPHRLDILTWWHDEPSLFNLVRLWCNVEFYRLKSQSTIDWGMNELLIWHNRPCHSHSYLTIAQDCSFKFESVVFHKRSKQYLL